MTFGDHVLSLEGPSALWLFALLPVLLLAFAISTRDDGWLRRALSFVLRAATLSALFVALARPVDVHESEDLSVVLAVDVSDSMSDAALREANELAESLLASRGESEVRILRFAARAEEVPIEDDRAPAFVRFEEAEAGRASSIASAIELAGALAREGTSRRLVIFSDGNDTGSAAALAAPRGMRVFTRAPSTPIEADVAVTSLDVPSPLEVGRTFAVRASVFSTRPGRARVVLFRDDARNAPESEKSVELVQGQNDVTFQSVVHVPGAVRYRVEVTPEGTDRFEENNRFTIGAFVPGRPTVLFVDPDPSRATQLPRALVAGDFDVEVRRPREFPTSMRELERFVFVVLSNVPASDLSIAAQDLVERYVRDTGGGLLVSGGDQGFELGGWQGTRLERLFAVRLDSERRREEPSLALALVIDRSGSMQGLKIQLAKEAAKATAAALGPEDFLGVIGFDTAPRRIVRMQSASNRSAIIADIGRLTASGGTSITPALDAAFQDLTAVRARFKHVILLTDGIAHEDGIADLVATMRADGITITTIGLGSDVQRALLEGIAAGGGGRAHFTSDPQSVPRIFVREATTVQQSSGVDEYVRATLVQRTDSLRSFDIGSAPSLHGYVATRARSQPAQVILNTDLGDPLLARMRFGLGWSLAWTSDMHSRWSAEWVRWAGFQPFWSGLVREHMRNISRESLPMRARIDGDELHVLVDAMDSDDRFLNGMESELLVRGPLGSTDPMDERLRLEQTAPGRYEARMPLRRYGAFEVRALHRREGVPFAESEVALGHPYPRELSRIAPDLERLRSLATTSNGRVIDDPAQVFAPLGDRTRSFTPRWPWFVMAAIALYLLELSVRRLGSAFPRIRRSP